MKLEELKNWLHYSRLPEDEKTWLPTVYFDHEAQMELFANYLETVEIFLVREKEKRGRVLKDEEEKVQKKLSKLKEEVRAGRIPFSNPFGPDYNDYESGIVNDVVSYLPMLEYWSAMVDGFADVLRKSFFVNLYGFWESQLFLFCNSLKNYDDAMSFENTEKFSPEHAKPLLREIGFPLGARVWSDIKDYGILRNCIVHHNGWTDRMGKERKRIKDLIRSEQLLLSLNGDKMIFNNGFCEKALDTINKYFDELLETLANWDLAQHAS